MEYDFQLVIGSLLVIFGIVGTANAVAEKRSTIGALLMIGMGCLTIGWAWAISGGTLTIYDLPNAIFRMLAVWI